MSIKEVIEARSSQLAEASNAGDAERVSQFCTEDSLLMPPSSPQVQGRAAIKDYWQSSIIDFGVSDLILRCHEATEVEDMTIVVGSLSCSVPAEGGSRTTIVEKYLAIWKKSDDGDWYLHRDSWNPDA